MLVCLLVGFLVYLHLCWFIYLFVLLIYLSVGPSVRPSVRPSGRSVRSFVCLLFYFPCKDLFVCFLVLPLYYFYIFDYLFQNVTGLAPNTTNVLNAAQVYRSIPILLSIEKQLNCEKTQLTTISWTVMKFDDDPRILNTLPNSNLRKSPYSTGISSPELLIAARDLPYGFYEIAARLEMKDLPDVFGRDSMYIQIVQTPWIEAATTGGSFNTVPFGNVVRW